MTALQDLEKEHHQPLCSPDLRWGWGSQDTEAYQREPGIAIKTLDGLCLALYINCPKVPFSTLKVASLHRGKCLRTPEVHHLSTRGQQRNTEETGPDLASHVQLPFQEPDLGGSWSQPIIGHRGMLCTYQGKLPLFWIEHDVVNDICVDFSLYPLGVPHLVLL